MRKCLHFGVQGLSFALQMGIWMGVPVVCAIGAPVTYVSLAQTVVQRAEADLERVKMLVNQGTLPKSSLTEAEASLADARDGATLARTLYSSGPAQDLSPADGTAMLEAAKRRVERQDAAVQSRRKLLDMGIIAKSDLTGLEDELNSRKEVLELAQNRMSLLDELRQMAKAEEQTERMAALSGPGREGLGKDVMIRYDGNGLFTLGDLTTLSSQFQRQFRRPLPISALGQTLVHQAMGLDHRNRVDVSLNPDEPEGVWLRAFLEKVHIPYLAFRSAVAGAATAPHIHIGPGSSHLKLAQR